MSVILYPTDGGDGHVNPSQVPLADRVRIRGAMWTARLNLPWGPRPGSDDNLICIDEYECYTPSDRARIVVAYGPKGRGYTDAPMGPLVDPGYHDQLPAVDWRSDPSPYFDAAQELEDNGIHVIHFLRPDRGVAGLEWTIDDLERELGPIFKSARAQKLMAKVVLGWEPGPRYFYDNAWWVGMVQWMADTFPGALRGIHMVNDCDAPVGGDDDRKGITNAMGWANVAPFIHAWYVQNAGYFDPLASRSDPGWGSQYRAFQTNFPAQFDIRVGGSLAQRFAQGYAGWPTFSAWGPTTGIKPIAAEFDAFANYHYDYPEEEGRALGDMALAAGAVGCLDGCFAGRF